MMGSRSCTKCGRRIPEEETVEYSWRRTEEGIEERFVCAVHTGHETMDNWEDEDNG